MVEEASKYEAEDKEVVARVEARNGAEAYLYNTRNAINEKKAVISEADATAVEATVKTGLAWLDEHREATKEEIETNQKDWEETIRPIMMKLYAAEAGKTDPAYASAAAPTVEEVD